jgi:hypothetical protein
MNKMPAYFQIYLDERFTRLHEDIVEVKNELQIIKVHVQKTNGHVARAHLKIVRNSNQIKFLMFLTGAAIVALIAHDEKLLGSIVRSFMGFVH